jgi:hypothetical protein
MSLFWGAGGMQCEALRFYSLFHSCLRTSCLHQRHIWHLKKRVLSQNPAPGGRKSAAQEGKTADFEHEIGL